MSTNIDWSNATGIDETVLRVMPEAAVVLWCIANGVVTTRRLPEETMFSGAGRRPVEELELQFTS